ncbi:hypothetical protein CC80DRAFT_67834 [Byssothecium circinans]|uniref:Uncharacterized protein n=1 Tax=Byssothecium circinans TaxID=147558 RepID=A0A6A5U4K4_9PLEO|nr:hypothetical protein CC80DRAFT_67834 [Byssothecium circinans]
MAYESVSETYRPHNPWEKFTQRTVANHHAEDSRLCPPQLPISTTEVIQRFLSHGYIRLDQAIPRKRQLLRDYLEETINVRQIGGASVVEHDIVAKSKSADVALLDDRQKHDRCAKLIGQVCNSCQILSTNLTIPELYRRLQQEVRLSDHASTHHADR